MKKKTARDRARGRGLHNESQKSTRTTDSNSLDTFVRDFVDHDKGIFFEKRWNLHAKKKEGWEVRLWQQRWRMWTHQREKIPRGTRQRGTCKRGGREVGAYKPSPRQHTLVKWRCKGVLKKKKNSKDRPHRELRAGSIKRPQHRLRPVKEVLRIVDVKVEKRIGKKRNFHGREG